MAISSDRYPQLDRASACRPYPLTLVLAFLLAAVVGWTAGMVHRCAPTFPITLIEARTVQGIIRRPRRDRPKRRANLDQQGDEHSRRLLREIQRDFFADWRSWSLLEKIAFLAILIAIVGLATNLLL